MAPYPELVELLAAISVAMQNRIRRTEDGEEVVIPPGTVTADSNTVTADSNTVTADGGTV